MSNAILHGGVDELNVIKEHVMELTGYQEKNAELLKEEARLDKLIAGKEKDLNDETENTLKKRKSELVAAYESQLTALNARNKKIKAKKEKDKGVKVSERISEETAELRDKNKELALEIKTKLKTDKTPTAPATRRQYSSNSFIVGARMPSGISISMPSIRAKNSSFGKLNFLTIGARTVATGLERGTSSRYRVSMSFRQIFNAFFFSSSGAGSSAISSIKRQKA